MLRPLAFASVLALFALACGSSTSNTGTGGTSSGGTSSGGTGGTSSGGTSSGGTSSGGTSSGGTSSGGTSSGGTGGVTTGGGGGPSCNATGKPYDAIHIELDPTAHCSFTLAEAAAGISIPYIVMIDGPMSDVVPESQVTCANPGPSGLFVFEELSGNGQSYCICDSGLCPPPSTTPVTLMGGSYPASFAWDGKNWFGPSDTGNPKGAPFPAGTYTLHLSAKGTAGGAAFDVTLDVPITLTP